MAPQRGALLWAALTIPAALFGTAWAQQQKPDGPSIPMDYCASINTADMVPLNSDYQSDGRCRTNCTSLSYALAIVQAKNCWCSNLIPNKADRKSLNSCQDPCPGYPWDYCGGKGAFGYMLVPGTAPTGTAPASGSSTDEPAVSSSTLKPATSSRSSSSVSTLSSSSSHPNTSSDGASVTTITVGGTVKTITATPTPTDPNGEPLIEKKSTGLQTGAIVGIVIGVVGGIAAVAAFLWLFFARRKRRAEEEKGLGSSIGGGGSPGPMSTPRTGEVSESRFTPSSTSPAAATWDSSNKRRSHLMPVDPRLDPFAKGIYGGDQNRSRESFNSLQDNQDYSRRVHQAPRVLRATNPDPDN